MRPRIGINMGLERLDDPLEYRARCLVSYIDAVVEAGGLPVLMPPLDDLDLLPSQLEGLHGFVLIGGPDYHPEAYGGHPQPEFELVHPRRHRWDLALIRLLLSQDETRPVLGICGGCQLIAIGCGARLVQDLPSQWPALAPQAPEVDHASGQDEGPPHAVTIVPGTRLATVIGQERIVVNSHHHQAVHPQAAGSRLQVSARADDGVIEGVELPGPRLVLGVQWHPERLPGQAPHPDLFRALVSAAG